LTGLAGLQIPVPPQPHPTWPYVVERFRRFLGNLELTQLQLADGLTKFKGVVSVLNAAYYGHNSETDNAFVIGSWAKSTAIRPPRDVDLYFLLPIEVYSRYEAYAPGTNRQSALLQEIKAKLSGSYPASEIKGDGPVVFAGFWTFNVEVVPAFRYDTQDRSFYVCDTKNGGNYSVTKPLHEVEALNAADARCNSNVRPLIRMLKAWQTYCNVPIKSFHLELLAADFLDQWRFKDKGLFYYDWMIRDFFAYMISRTNTWVFAPGTFNILPLGDAWKTRAESAYSRACKACYWEQNSNMGAAGDEWQKIFGNYIPKNI